MNTHYLTHVRKIFSTYDAPPEVIRSYQKQWVKSVRQLGDKWLVAKPIERIQWLQDKMQSRIYRMVTTAVTVLSLKQLAHAVEKTTSYLSGIYTMKTKKQWLKNI